MSKVKDYIIHLQEDVELPELPQDPKQDLETQQAIQADMEENEATGN